METSNTNDHAKKEFDVRKDGLMGAHLNVNKVELDDGMLPDVIDGLRAQVTDLFGTVSKLETTITELRSDDHDEHK